MRDRTAREPFADDAHERADRRDHPLDQVATVGGRQEFVLCAGGKGGKGNVHFKSAKNRAPVQYTEGEEGEQGHFLLELRTIADAALVGYPNAGKSTLLGKISAAHPKVAAYPFTTLRPSVGVVELDDYRRATIADIPGLIEGAHRNVGLGHDFLRHITRCRCLFFVVDIAGSEGRHPVEDLQSLRREIDLYDPRLSQRPWCILANKMDLPESERKSSGRCASDFPSIRVIPISAAKGEGIEAIKEQLRVWLRGKAERSRGELGVKKRSASGRQTAEGREALRRNFHGRTNRSQLLHDFSEAGDAAHLPAGHGAARIRDLRHDQGAAEQRALSDSRISSSSRRPQNNPLRHGWLKFVKRRPPIVYRGEYQMLSSLLQRRGADLMHIYFGHTGVHLLPFIERWDKPCVVSFHGADVAVKKDIRDYDLKLQKSFSLRAAGPRALQFARGTAGRAGLSARTFADHAHGMPLHEFPYMRREAPADGRWQFMQACRLIPKKGVATTLCAFAIFQKDFPESGAASSPGKGRCRRILRSWRKSSEFREGALSAVFSRSRICGNFTRARISSFIPAKRRPTRTRKAFPIPSWKRWRPDCPCSATRHGGIPEAVEQGRSGLLVEERDFEALANAMKDLARSAMRFREMGLLGSERVVAEFEIGAQVRQLERYYDEAVGFAPAAEPARRPQTARPRRVFCPASGGGISASVRVSRTREKRSESLLSI